MLRHQHILILLVCLAPHAAAAQTIPSQLRECALAVPVALPRPETRLQPSQEQMEDARRRIREFQASMSEAEFDECMTLSVAGLEHGFEPVTYTLDPGRWVELSLRGATIVSQGTSRLFKWGIVREGIRFLPPRYTELLAGRPQTRRHFIEIFAWTRETPRRDLWQLTWWVFEVEGGEMIPAGAHRLMTVTAPQAPVTGPDTLHDMAMLLVNELGFIEWRAPGADDTRGVIASQADLRTEAQEQKRREAALEKVDWERSGDIRRVPALAYGDSDGCGLIVVQGWSADRMEAMYLQADAELLRLSSTPQTFDIARQPATIQLAVHVFANPVRRSPFCTDVSFGPLQTEAWRAIGGQITIELVPGLDPAGQPRTRATIRLTGAVFVNAQGARVTQSGPIVLTAIVGAFHG